MANVFTQDVLDQLRCSMCKGYLSCSPVCVLPNGRCICGRCTPSCDVLVYRALPFEILLNQVSFPCQLKENGCTERVLFDHVADHESTCVYRSISCPSLTLCEWEGSTARIHNHFSEQHSGLVKETAEFELKTNEDAKGIFITKKDDVLFLVKYLYNVFENCLKYDVRYCMNWRKNEATYKVQLINNADSDCSVNLKTNKCLIFDNTFYDAQNAQILKLSKYLDILDNPTAVRFAINLMVLESCATSTNQEIKLVDKKLPESAKCRSCNNCLIPPHSVGTICWSCSKFNAITVRANTELVKLVSEINYPCQWRNCNFIGNAENIRQHYLSCRFRLYRCHVPSCESSISLTTVAEHSQKHDNCHYLPPNAVYKMIFSKPYDEMYIWATKNDTLIAIEHSASNIKTFTPRGFVASVTGQILRLVSDLIQCTVTVEFEHCDVKSKPFLLVSGKPQSIDISKLPTCFNELEEVSLIISKCEFSLN